MIEGMESTGWSELAGDCYAAGIGFSYKLTDRLQLSAGTVFTKFLFEDKEAYYERMGEFEAPKGDNWNSGIGFAFKACSRLTLNLALGATFWKKEMIDFLVPVEVKAHAYSISVGINLDL
jgi:long-subunit fatty acid transport protein